MNFNNFVKEYVRGVLIWILCFALLSKILTKLENIFYENPTRTISDIIIIYLIVWVFYMTMCFYESHFGFNFSLKPEIRTFIHYQINKRESSDNSEDCVIRAFSKVTKKTWDEQFTDINKCSIENSGMPHDFFIIKKYMESIGYKYNKVKNGRFLKNRVNTFNTPFKDIIVMVGDGHVVACDCDGYYDIWDSGKMVITGYFEKQIQ